MAMSDRRILAAREEGRIVIEPFRRDFLSTSSYDVCLGEFYYREQVPHLEHDVFNLYDPEHVKRVWGEAQRARWADEVFPDFRLENIRKSDQVILLNPGETILAHTAEFIGGQHSITTMMKARSSIGRSFVLVCKCAGWGDIGYINRWTFEITNVSQHYRIPLVVGERIAQIVFFETGEALDKEYGETGNYQDGLDLASVMNNWSPQNMLPKTRRSPEVQP